jgi:hypothetical protein
MVAIKITFGIFACYALIAFVKWEQDVSEWNFLERLLMAVFSIASSFAISVIELKP